MSSETSLRDMLPVRRNSESYLGPSFELLLLEVQHAAERRVKVEEIAVSLSYPRQGGTETSGSYQTVEMSSLQDAQSSVQVHPTGKSSKSVRNG